MTEQGEAHATGFRAAGTGWLLIGSIIGAITAYLFIVLIGRGLGNVEFAPINAQWTVLFLTLTIVFVPLEGYATREVARGRHALKEDRRVLAVVALGAAVVVALVLWSLSSTFFDGRHVFVAQIAVAVVAYAFFFMVKGQAFGMRRFASVGFLMAGEGTARLVVGLVLLWIVGTPEAVGWSFLAGPLIVLLVRVPAPRSQERIERTTAAGGFLSSYVWASGASQLLLGIAPVLVGVLGAGKVIANVVFQTFTLFRAPLSLLYAVQGRLLSAFLRFVDAGESGSLRKVGAVLGALGIGLVGVGTWVGTVAGPDVVRLLVGDEFAPAADIAGLAAGGVVAAFFAQVGGQVLIAQGRAARLGASWTVGIVIGAVMVMLGSGERPELDVAWGFFIGEIAAFCVVTLIVLISNRPVAPDALADGGSGGGAAVV